MNEYSSAFIQLALFISVPLMVYLLKRIRRQEGTPLEGFWQWLGVKKPLSFKPLLKPMGLTFILSLIIMLIPLWGLMHFNLLDYSQFLMQDFQNQPFSIGLLVLLLLNAWIKTALSEEILFRGFIGKGLQRKLGFQTAMIGQGILFGLPHGLPLILSGGSILAGLVLIISAALVGMLQFGLNEKYAEGSIAPSFIVHGLMNTLSFLSVLF